VKEEADDEDHVDDDVDDDDPAVDALEA